MSFINDVTALVGRGIKDFVKTVKSLITKKRDDGGGGGIKKDPKLLSKKQNVYAHVK